MKNLIDFNNTTPDFGRPYINYNKGVLTIGDKKGRHGSKLHPDEPGVLFTELNKAIERNLEFNISLYFRFYLSYVNSTSMKYLRDLLVKLNDYFTNGKKDIKVFWFYPENDETIFEQGDDLLFIVDGFNKQNVKNGFPKFKFELIDYNYES